jgi:hypothetical protein
MIIAKAERMVNEAATIADDAADAGAAGTLRARHRWGCSGRRLLRACTGMRTTA